MIDAVSWVAAVVVMFGPGAAGFLLWRRRRARQLRYGIHRELVDRIRAQT